MCGCGDGMLCATHAKELQDALAESRDSRARLDTMNRLMFDELRLAVEKLEAVKIECAWCGAQLAEAGAKPDEAVAAAREHVAACEKAPHRADAAAKQERIGLLEKYLSEALFLVESRVRTAHEGKETGINNWVVEARAVRHPGPAKVGA